MAKVFSEININCDTNDPELATKAATFFLDIYDANREASLAYQQRRAEKPTPPAARGILFTLRADSRGAGGRARSVCAVFWCIVRLILPTLAGEVESVAVPMTLQDMVHRHVNRVMRKDGIILPTRHGEPRTNWFGRALMTGQDALPEGYHFLQLCDDDGRMEIRDSDGALETTILPVSDRAAYMLGDLFGFIPGYDTPPELRLSHLVSEWLVVHYDESFRDAPIMSTDSIARVGMPNLTSTGYEGVAVTTLQVTAVCATSSNFTFVTEWPSDMAFKDDKVDIYSSVNLLGLWNYFGEISASGVNAATVSVNKVDIPNYAAAIPAPHTNGCFVITNIVASGLEQDVCYTNIYWNCDHKSVGETPGFFRLADRTDSDYDGIPDAVERWVYGTDPNSFDTDGDGLDDGLEMSLMSNPKLTDSDGDGIDDGTEVACGTNPASSDTDGDGVSDSDEIRNGSDPTDASDAGVASDEIEGGDAEVVRTPEATGNGGYAMSGSFAVSMTYSDNTTPEYSIHGIHPPGGSTTVAWFEDEESGPYYKNAFSLTAAGADFIPATTGWYSFQITADDDAEIGIGDRVTATAHYPQGGGVVSNLFVAGVHYPVTVSWSSIGGPAALVTNKWGVYSKAERLSLSAGFTKKTVIMEGAYEDSPGVNRANASTTTTLKISVTGGAFGGVLSLQPVGSGSLELNEGSANISETSIEPGCSRVLRSTYCGGGYSNSTNDTGIAVCFRENLTGETLITTARVTVVKVTLMVTDVAPENMCDYRHVYGIGERVLVMYSPAIDNMQVNVQGGTYTSTVSGRGELNWDVEDHAHGLRFEAGQCVYSPIVRVLVPTGVLGVSPSAEINTQLSVGAAGGVHLKQIFKILPLNVSFSKLKIEEVPCNDPIEPQGNYFQHLPSADYPKTHTRAAGAGNWIEINPGENTMNGFDRAGTWSALPRIRDDGALASPTDTTCAWDGGGTLIWKIPFGWKHYLNMDTNASPNGVFAQDVRQSFILSANGDLIIRKLGNSAGRSVQGAEL